MHLQQPNLFDACAEGHVLLVAATKSCIDARLQARLPTVSDGFFTLYGSSWVYVTNCFIVVGRLISCQVRYHTSKHSVRSKADTSTALFIQFWEYDTLCCSGAASLCTCDVPCSKLRCMGMYVQYI